MDKEKFAYFVIGPESSGTKMVTRLLIQGGCFGSDDHDQFIDEVLEDEYKLRNMLRGIDKVVVRRSVPHGVKHKNPNIKKVYDALVELDYAVTFVVVTRSWPTMILSHVDMQQHSKDEESALKTIKDAVQFIHYWIKRLKADYIQISYGDILRNRTVTLHWLFTSLGLDYTMKVDTIVEPEREAARVKEYRSRM